MGLSTAHSLANVASQVDNNRLAPRNIKGADSGTGERLARFILDDCCTYPGSGSRRPYLYLTGDKNADVLQTILSAGGLQVDNLAVYETTLSPKFSAGLSDHLSAYSSGVYLLFWSGIARPHSQEQGIPTGGLYSLRLRPPSSQLLSSELILTFRLEVAIHFIRSHHNLIFMSPRLGPQPRPFFVIPWVFVSTPLPQDPHRSN